MNWFKFFRLAGNGKKRQLSNRTQNPRRPHALRLETLEDRVVPAAPFVQSVVPGTGALLGPTITIQYSEDVIGANVAGNYRLFDSEGALVDIAGVNYDSSTFVATIQATALSVDGGPLTAGTYSLFLRADQIVDVDEGLPMARPGELVVANVGRNSLSTVSLTGSGLGAVSTVGLPAEGTTNYFPSAIASADLNRDGIPDLIVASGGQSTINVYLGNPLGGFSLLPDLVLDLPAGSNPTALVVTDLNNDDVSNIRPDIAVANSGTGSVTVFINQNSTPGELLFDPGANYVVAAGINGMVAGAFVGPNIDLALSSSTADANGFYNVYVITGNGDGTFNTAQAFQVGDNTGIDLQLPNSIVAAQFDDNKSLDIAVGGSNGVSVLRNNSAAGVLAFTAPTFIGGSAATSLAAGVIRTNAGGSTKADIVVTTSAGGGSIYALLNNGSGVFQSTGLMTAGVAAPTGLQLRDLNGSAGSLEAVYVNNDANGGLVSRSAIQSGLISNASNTTPIVITSDNHGLQNGQRVVITGVQANTGANGTFYITSVTTNTFTLVDGTGNAVAIPNTGTWIALPGIITNVTKTGSNPIVVTAPNHGLRTGQQITISGVGGAVTSNGTFFITRINANSFSLNGTEGTPLGGAYTLNTGTFALPVFAAGANSVGVALADFSGDGILDAVVANKTANTSGTLSYYTGGGSLGVGDGTFLTATNLPLAGNNSRPVDVAVGDLNGDGIPDLVATDTKNNQIHLFFGLQGGGYSSPTTISLTAGGNSRNPVSVAIGDLNGDGKQDIVVASQQDSNVAIFLGNGDGSFKAATRVSVGTAPTQVILADINNDKVLDLLVAHNGGGGFFGASRGVTLRLGNGNGTFQGKQEIFGSKNQPRASGLAVADFNRDGFLDVAVTDDNAPGAVRVALNSGTGTFPSANITTFSVGPNPTAIIAADFNADGFADIATISRSDTTTDNVSVLLNNLGTGFQSAIHTTVENGLPLRSIQAVKVDTTTPFMDLVVTSQFVDLVNNTTGKTSPDGLPDPDTPNPINNTHVLFGTGDGSFRTTIAEYTVTGPGTAEPKPSDVTLISDPFQLLSTFSVGGTTVSVNLIRNGNFEARDLTGEQGNLTGWTTFKLTDTTRGSAGQWLAQTGSNSPLSLTTVPPPSNGRYRAMLDQQNLQPFRGNTNPNDESSYAGSHAIYQDIVIPANASTVRLSFTLYLNSSGDWSDPGSNPQLDYRTTEPNQQVRIDIMSPSGNVLDVGANVRMNIFQTQLGGSTNTTIVRSGSTAIDLSAFKGQTIRLRIASTNNQGKLIVGLDDVRVQTVFVDTTAPQLLSLNLRNPTFLAGPNSLEQSTDPTFVGRVTDNGSINNVRQIIFDLANNGFGNSDDAIITNIDANGYFSFTATSLLPGVQTIPVRVVDQAGQFVTSTFNFVLQGPSLTNWQAVGPGPIDVSSANVNYNTVSGKITGIVVDPSDPSGNTFYIGSANGGVWRTTNGGKDWLALTDNIIDGTGQRINVSVGSMTLGVNPTTGARILFAATGLDDNAFTSRSSVGILRSSDNGVTWQVLGGATSTSPGVFGGARVSKIAVDPSNPNIVYVAITSWDDSSREPMVLKTTNALAADPNAVVWTNVLLPQNMFNPGRQDTIGAGTALASVTDLIVDPFNPGRIIVGLGNIGQRTSSSTAGVWKSIDFGATWEKVIGGDNPSIANSTIPEGNSVGRVTLAQGTGRVGDERFIYVLMSTPLNLGLTNQFNQGSFLGLYKSKDNMLNFTKVMLKEPGFGHGRFTENYVDIGLLGNEGANVGSLAVDPSNPNVVYVGGSRRFDLGGVPQHSLIRVDTGNMRDTTYGLGGFIPNDGDDIDKAEGAALAGGQYPTDPVTGAGGVTYTGEGVYWYDIEMARAQDTRQPDRRRLPASIQRIVFDTQGRLLFGTENGLYRGVPLGFGYDFRSGFAGILAVGGGGPGGGGAFNPPGMAITELNGNLSITDLTSVAVDPTDRDRLYISASGVGSALTANGSSWETMGLTGPTVAGIGNLGIPNSFQVLTANRAPDAPADAVTTLYRLWQFRGGASLIPELSIDAGGTFNTTGSAGISSQDQSGLAPVLAINTKKAEVSGQFFDELLFGTDKVYLTRTGGNVWDAISGPLSGGSFVTAVAFSPTDGEYLAATDDGKIFIKRAAGTSFVEITANLATLLGPAAGARINGITVDPRNANTVYVMLSTPTGFNSVYRTTNAGSATPTWAAVSTGLPQVPSYKLIIDPRPSTGALSGRMYLGTDRGVFTSVNNGATWAPLGAGLPAAPVVDLVFNPELEILAAATQGRGVFTLSTARSGPAVTSATPTNLIDNPVGLSQIEVTFNTPVDPRTFTADSNNAARTAAARAVLNTMEYKIARITELELQYRRVFAQAVHINNGLTYFNSGPNGELEFIAFLVSSPHYFNNNFYGLDTNDPNFDTANERWLEQAYLDLFGRSSVGDGQRTNILNFLNTTVPGQEQNARLALTRQLIGINPSSFNNPLSAEFQTRLFAAHFNKYLAANAPISATQPASGAYTNAINAAVATLQSRVPYATVLAQILSTTSAYQKSGNDYALPAGYTATAVTLGSLTGASDTFGNTIPDLIVAASNGSHDKLYIFKGRVGGGYNSTADLVLDLPDGAAASQIVVADLNGDGFLDIVVANAGLTAATTNTVSVFLNTRTMKGQLSFGSRTDFNGGNNPVGIAVGNIDNDGSGFLDVVTANRTVNGVGNYTISVLLGNGTGSLGAPTQLKVGDDNPTAAELEAPTGIALANVTGDSKPDFIVSGDNGLVVMTNTSTTGSPSGTLLANRLSNIATTSVAAGLLDDDAAVDIVATSNVAGGELLVFHNTGGGNFNPSTIIVGPNPQSIKLADLNGDGKSDIVLANNVLGGGVSMLFNTSSTTGITFTQPIVYPVTGSRPVAIALGDTNQDGLLDVVTTYGTSEFFSLMNGLQQGVMQVATDRVWTDWLYRALAGRTPTLAERSALETILRDGYLVYINGQDGIIAPISVTPSDTSNLSYTLTFAPRLLNGVYALWIGPNAQGVNLKDFTDLNGSFINTGNAMNQNRNAFNGENPDDRIRIRFAVNTSDNGRFISALFEDFQGLTVNNGRPADSEGFINLFLIVEPARQAAMTTMAANFAQGVEATNRIVTDLYDRLMKRAPTGTELSTATNQIRAGQITVRDFVVQILASNAYFTEAQVGVNGDNAAWLNQIYLDTRNTPVAEIDPGFATKITQLNNGTRTRTQIATAVIFGDAGIKQAISEYFIQYLGRGPVRNADPALDETTNFNGVNFTALFKQGAIPGVVSPDQQLIAALLASPEYLRIVGNSNFEWVKSLYTNLFGRASIDTDPVTGVEFNSKLNTLLNNSSAARQQALSTVITNQEYRNRVYTDYYNQFLNRSPSATELATQQAFFTANNNRLEAVVANILRTAEYFPLSGPGSSNATWLATVYQALLGRGTTNDPTAASQLAFLNSESPPVPGKNSSTLSTARFTVALQVLNSTEYRQIFVTSVYTTYLGRTPTTAERDFWVGQMNNEGLRQQNVLIRLLKDAEYFLLQ